MAKNLGYKNLVGETDAPVVEKEERNEKKGKKPLPLAGLRARIKATLPTGRNGRKKKLGKGKVTGKRKAVRTSAIVVLLTMAVVAAPKVMGGSGRASAGTVVQETATMERRSIISNLSSPGVISSKDTHNMTALASGEVITADFEERDQVEKGQALCTIDTSSMGSELRSVQDPLEKTQTPYGLAVEDYNEAVNGYSGSTHKSTKTGFIRTLYIRAGDKVDGNTKITDIYSGKVTKIRMPFLSGEATAIGAGNQGVVTLTETGEQLLGIVTSVSNMEEMLTGGWLVRRVTLEVENPDGLTSAHMTTVTAGDLFCTLEGTFEANVDTVMGADLSSSVKVESTIVVEGGFVSKGTVIFRMSSKSTDSLVRSYKDAMDRVQESLESVQSKVDNTQDSYENYMITVLISGTVIIKSVKTGDKISDGGNSGTVTLTTIYDLSQVTLEMSVDELDVQSMQVGQSVVVTTGAFESQTPSGRMTNTSLASSNSNNVISCPVMVTLDEVGGLLPGVNVDGQVILEEAEDALTVPVDPLVRGNKIYVKNDTMKEANGAAPAGLHLVEMETGLTNDGFVGTVGGFSGGDMVYVAESPASSSFSMGMMMPGGDGDVGGALGGGGNRGGQGGGPGGGRPQTDHQGGETW